MAVNNINRDDFDAGPTNLDLIEPGLWLGNLTAALDVRILESHGINHILTVDSCPLPRNISSLQNVKTKFIQITDLPYEDLISHFDETYEFVKGGQENGNVLVHCYFGVSRSAAVVAAFLMKKYSILYEEAIERIKAHRTLVGPNRGFEAQLRLYQCLNYVIDKNNLQYKMFKLRVTADKVAKVRIVPQDCLSVIKPDPSLVSTKPDSCVYRCKKCRRIVASTNNLLPHVKFEKSSWKDPKWSSDYAHMDLCDQIYFIEPMSWITSVSQSESGKILCPKCKVKLGSFSWIMGSKCPCGSKVSPAFYIIPSKVDYSNVVQNVQVTI